ncbi:hypothetical protein HBA54_03310 [Pelagibius litoralis]|uniref:Uncharacterized protein n=1 Tax=Pelagibius litoralis TaxID=374515 RepID=A0A967EUS3_9PROT|nr:hypothetical protein [Pelagibius litoralis]NIA67611.1 hypothetical protein [Pelagibius litoralis]
MTFADLTGIEPGSNQALQWFHRSSGKPRETLRMLEETLAAPEPERPRVSAGQFVDQIDESIQEQGRHEVMSVLVHLKQSEIKALVRRAAHAKGRYLAALMELPRNQANRKAAVGEVSLLRQEYEELETGLKTLRQLILDNDIDIIGVD